MTRYTNPVPKYTDESGDFMPYGLLYFYESGTNEEKTTFADVNETIANTQPLVLNGDGSVPNCFYSGAAKVVLITNAGTPSLPVDGAQQWERDPVSSGAIGAVGRDWDAISIYDVNSVVNYSGVLWVSIINNNQNNIPSAVATAWTQFDLLKRFNINETYQTGDPVIASNGFLYTSLTDDNLGDDPTLASGTWTLPTIQLSSARNILINSDFQIRQWGESVVDPTSSNEFNTADRHRFRRVGVSVTGMAVSYVTTNVDVGYPEVIKVNRSNGDSNTERMIMMTQIKSSDITPYQGKTLTYTFRLRLGSSFTPTSFSIIIQSGTAVDESIPITGEFPTGNEIKISDITSVDVSNKSSYQTVSVTFVFPPSAQELSIRLSWVPSGTTTDTQDSVRFAWEQLESGSEFTTYERQGSSSDAELALCQPYCFTLPNSLYRVTGTVRAATFARVWFPFPTTMRTTPTLLAAGVAADYNLASTSLVSCTALPAVAVGTGKNGANLEFTVASGLIVGYSAQVHGEKLLFNAELNP